MSPLRIDEIGSTILAKCIKCNKTYRKDIMVPTSGKYPKYLCKKCILNQGKDNV